MLISIQSQSQLFLLAILLGAILGISYDCLRIFRRALHHKSFFVQTEDALFWIIAIFLIFTVFLKKNFGEIRFFCVLGILGGALIYFLTLSRLLISISDKIIIMIKKIFYLFFQVVSTPFRLIFLLFRKPLKKAENFCTKMRKKILQSCKIYVKIKITKFLHELKIITKKRGMKHEKTKKEKKKY